MKVSMLSVPIVSNIPSHVHPTKLTPICGISTTFGARRTSAYSEANLYCFKGQREPLELVPGKDRMGKYSAGCLYLELGSEKPGRLGRIKNWLVNQGCTISCLTMWH